ncbi:MAG: (2Fe-2S)-binding protein [Acidimicrobiales bacterium]
MGAATDYVLTVNGRDHRVVDAWEGESLLYVLRERLGLPGAKNACEQGECGSCSVLVDGTLVCACLVLAAAAPGQDIVTVEGLARVGGGPAPGEPQLTDVQAAFVVEGAVQCGFCTPGLIMAVHDLLDRCPDASEPEVREAISGNLCRCTGYGRILEAVRAVQATRLGRRLTADLATTRPGDDRARTPGPTGAGTGPSGAGTGSP